MIIPKKIIICTLVGRNTVSSVPSSFRQTNLPSLMRGHSSCVNCRSIRLKNFTRSERVATSRSLMTSTPTRPEKNCIQSNEEIAIMIENFCVNMKGRCDVIEYPLFECLNDTLTPPWKYPLSILQCFQRNSRAPLRSYLSQKEKLLDMKAP